jgi:hypothetical protein
MRRSLILTVVLAAFASTALAANHTVTLPTAFKSQLAKLHGKGIGPILLPQTLTSEAKKVYPSVITVGHGYELDLGAVKGCGGANACFVAEFSASRRSPFGPTRVTLAHGIIGHFKPLTCGGSCSPPSIEFVQSGFTYSIQANVGTEKTEESILISMANSAITHGAR